MCECLVLMRANLVCNHNRPQAGHLHHSAHTWPYLTTLLTIFPTQHTCKNTHTHLATLLTLLTLDHTLTHTLDHCTTHTWPYLPDTSPNAAVCWKLNSIFTTSAAIIQKTKKSKGNLKYGMQQFEQRGPNISLHLIKNMEDKWCLMCRQNKPVTSKVSVSKLMKGVFVLHWWGGGWIWSGWLASLWLVALLVAERWQLKTFTGCPTSSYTLRSNFLCFSGGVFSCKTSVTW